MENYRLKGWLNSVKEWLIGTSVKISVKRRLQNSPRISQNTFSIFFSSSDFRKIYRNMESSKRHTVKEKYVENFYPLHMREFSYDASVMMRSVYGSERDRTNLAIRNFYVKVDLLKKRRERSSSEFSEEELRFWLSSERSNLTEKFRLQVL